MLISYVVYNLQLNQEHRKRYLCSNQRHSFDKSSFRSESKSNLESAINHNITNDESFSINNLHRCFKLLTWGWNARDFAHNSTISLIPCIFKTLDVRSNFYFYSEKNTRMRI